MTLVSPRRWPSGGEDPREEDWRSRPTTELLAELVEELAAELLADAETADQDPGSGATVTAEESETDGADHPADQPPLPSSRVEVITAASKPASQIFVDEQRRTRRVIAILITLVKLAILVYAIVVAIGFVDLLA